MTKLSAHPVSNLLTEEEIEKIRKKAHSDQAESQNSLIAFAKPVTVGLTGWIPEFCLRLLVAAFCTRLDNSYDRTYGPFLFILGFFAAQYLVKILKRFEADQKS